MALINCIECNKQISDKAEICVGCGAPLEKPNIIIGTTFIIGNLEVAQNDFPISMNWDDAVNSCAELGEGWRLPNKDELKILYLNKENIGCENTRAYWSSSICIEYSYPAWFQNFINGNQNSYSNVLKHYVRAVRLSNY
jgi:hypothetical protein